MPESDAVLTAERGHLAESREALGGCASTLLV